MADIFCAASSPLAITAAGLVRRARAAGFTRQAPAITATADLSLIKKTRASAAGVLAVTATAALSRNRTLASAAGLSMVSSVTMNRGRDGFAANSTLSLAFAANTRRNPGFKAPASVISMTAVFSAPMKNPGFAAAASIVFGVAMALPKNVPVAAESSFAMAASAAMAKATPAKAAAKMEFTTKACPDRGRDAIGVCEVVADILHLWGFTNPRSAPSYAVNRALTDLNGGLQVVWNQADMRDYWSKSTLEIEILGGQSSLALPDDVQNVTGLCRVRDSRRTMVNLGTLGELELFSDLYLNGESVGEPVAYHIQRENQAGNDPARCIFHVTPAPADDTDFLLEVVKEAPRFGIRDITDCPRIPIPHRYVESLLLPVVRKRAASYYLFTAADKLPIIEQEYMEARMALGMADPLPGNAGDNMSKRKGGEA